MNDCNSHFYYYVMGAGDKTPEIVSKHWLLHGESDFQYLLDYRQYHTDNAVSFTEFNYYHSTPPKYYNIRRTSDKLCEEYGLSVIRNPQGKGKSYIEHTAAKQGKSWKAQLKNTIDVLIPLSWTFFPSR